MTRTMAFAVALLSVADVRADIPPPRGRVHVPVDPIFTTDKAFPDYVFVVVVGGEADWCYKAELTRDKPLQIEGKNRNGRARLCWLAAVPVEAAREFETDRELVAAVVENKVKGVLRSSGGILDSFAVVPEKDAPKVIEEMNRVERITSEEGIVVSSEEVGRAEDPEESDEGSRTRWALAGIAAALADCAGGLWLVTRNRSRRSAV